MKGKLLIPFLSPPLWFLVFVVVRFFFLGIVCQGFKFIVRGEATLILAEQHKARRVIKWRKFLIFFFFPSVKALWHSWLFKSQRKREETCWSSGWNDRRCLENYKKQQQQQQIPRIIQTSFFALWNLCQWLRTWIFTSGNDGTRQ